MLGWRWLVAGPNGDSVNIFRTFVRGGHTISCSPSCRQISSSGRYFRVPHCVPAMCLSLAAQGMRAGLPSLPTPMPTSTDTFFTSLARLHFSTIPSRHTQGISSSIYRFHHAYISCQIFRSVIIFRWRRICVRGSQNRSRPPVTQDAGSSPPFRVLRGCAAPTLKSFTPPPCDTRF